MLSSETQLKEGSDLENDENHYNQYKNVETAIGDSNLMHDAVNETVETPSKGLATESASKPAPRNEVTCDDTGLDEYIRTTVRNLAQLGFRNGMSRQRVRDLIHDGINTA